MAYKGLMEDVKTCVNLGIPRRIPIFPLTEEFDVRMYGGITYEEYATDADVMVAVHKEVVKRYDYDWAWLQVDDCIEFEILGVGVRGEGDILRATCDYLPPHRETLKKLKIPDPQKDGRMPILLEAIRKLREEFGDTVCICGRTAAPFSSTALLYGIEETMMLILSDPQLLKDTNQFFVELQSIWGKAQIEAGAQALWFGDCNAMSNLISLAHYEEFAFPYAQEVAREYKKAGGLTLYHASEEKPDYLKKQMELGIDVLSCGTGTNMKEAKEIAKGKICLIGNLDPLEIIERGTPEVVEKEARRLIEEVGKEGGYIFGSGEMVPRDTPEENIKTMVRTVRKYGTFSP